MNTRFLAQNAPIHLDFPIGHQRWSSEEQLKNLGVHLRISPSGMPCALPAEKEKKLLLIPMENGCYIKAYYYNQHKAVDDLIHSGKIISNEADDIK